MLTMDDTVRFEDMGLIPLQDHFHPMTPNFENKTISIPGRSGLWHFGSDMRERPFTIPIGVMERDQVLKQQHLNSVVAFLYDQKGQPREIKAVFDYEPDKFYKLKLSQPINPSRFIGAARFDLALVAYDPYKYAYSYQYDPDENYYYDQLELYNTGLYYDNPQSFNWNFERHYTGIYNYSHLESNLMFKITGTVTNPSITKTDTHEVLTLPSINGGTLVVNGDAFSIKVNGQDSIGDSNYNFFMIQPGDVGFLFSGENPNATVTFEWLHKFI